MRSMTGFGRAEGQIGAARYTVEIKSVNHRYLDLRFRLPAGFSSLEPMLTDLLKEKFERGSLDVVVRQAPGPQGGSAGTKLQADETAASSFIAACQSLSKTLKVPITPTAEAMALTGRVFLPVEEPADESVHAQRLRELALQAADGVAKMRAAEGSKLAGVLKAGAREVAELAEQCRRVASDHPRLVREKLQARIAQWSLGAPTDAGRLEWEVAYFAERSDITEEIDRLRSHAQAFETLLAEPSGVGRKLDFLTQEMHREVNTMGSKAASLELTRLTVEGKQRIEKLREQAQNVE